MSRKSEFQTKSPNPAQMFLEWKSEKQCFSYWDKEKQQNVDVKLPLTFLTLMERHTVKGWHDASESAIYANEVEYISTETLNVRSFKGGTIAEGLYKDIKSEVLSAGGHYTNSIYVMLKDGTIANIQLKGSGVQSWQEFVQKTRSRLPDEWVTVTGADERKKGRVKYSVPVFEFNKSLSKKEAEMADAAYDELKEYMESYKKAPIEDLTPKQYEEEAIEDLKSDKEFRDLPF